MSHTPSQNPETGKRFNTMAPREKLAFIGKAFVFFLSGGFVYPTMWTD